MFRAHAWPALVALALTAGSLLPGCAPASPAPQVVAAPTLAADSRITVVEWRIKKGREQDFLNYWSTQATIGDRSGLIGEFLSRIESPDQFPFTVWDLDPRWTTYVNIGIWRSNADYHQQIGRFVDLSRPPLDFEAERRRRLLIAPERWRIGATPFLTTDHPAVR